MFTPWKKQHWLAAAALILFVIAALAAHGTLNTDETETLGYAGLACLAAAFLPWRT